jgi:hypothetical protein
MVPYNLKEGGKRLSDTGTWSADDKKLNSLEKLLLASKKKITITFQRIQYLLMQIIFTVLVITLFLELK